MFFLIKKQHWQLLTFAEVGVAGNELRGCGSRHVEQSLVDHLDLKAHKAGHCEAPPCTT